jgi:hypothetical protein
MLFEEAEKKKPANWFEREKAWFDESLSYFADKLPQMHLLNQLYMFSENYNIEEAHENIRSLNMYFFTEEFNKGIKGLNQTLNLGLIPIHARAGKKTIEISGWAGEKLAHLLKPEYKLLSSLRSNG